MARNDRAMNRVNKNMRNLAQSISSSMDDLHRATYMSTPQQSKDLDDLNDRINQSIDNIVNANINAIGSPSVTKLYSRLADANHNSTDVVQDIGNLFDVGIMTEDIYGMFASNRYLRELDTEIDTVCRYMPRLEEALDVQKDCVLSADHFSKDFINVQYPGYSIDEIVFSERIKDLKKKYKLETLAEDIYIDTAKYGEKFIYRVPYKTAIGRLLATKPDGSLLSHRMNESTGEENIHEYYLFNMDSRDSSIKDVYGSSLLSESTVVTESITDRNNNIKQVQHSYLKNNESFNIAIEINRSDIIESAVEEYREVEKKRSYYKNRSMKSIYEAAHPHRVQQEASNKEIEAKGNVNWGSNTIDKRFIASNDGLITGANPDPIKLDVYGCVVKELKRDHVIPIYIEDICMGYYYFEVLNLDNSSDSSLEIKNMFGDPLNNMKGNLNGLEVDTTRQDEAIRFIAGQLSKFIDKKFVNHNQDLAREIYMILKYNDLFNSNSLDMIRVTFIPPEDMVHSYFRLDKDMHRGISDLAKSLIPAKIYSTMYITDAIAHMTRGQDKRVYYVKQTVDTNVAQTLLNTIQQIKQGNFGIRNFNSINNVLNITGKFNDYVIPTNASGDPPIQFEVMPGQDIKTPTELMENLEQMAINATGIPFEIIQSRQSVDYAMQLTMSSSKVLRWTYNRQERFQAILSDLITSIYNYEYDDSVELKVTLPPPSFINVTNTNQIIDNTKTFTQSLAEIELANEQDDKLKNQYASDLFKYYIGTHIDTATHEQILEKSRLKLKTEQDESHSDTAGDDSY